METSDSGLASSQSSTLSKMRQAVQPEVAPSETLKNGPAIEEDLPLDEKAVYGITNKMRNSMSIEDNNHHDDDDSEAEFEEECTEVESEGRGEMPEKHKYSSGSSSSQSIRKKVKYQSRQTATDRRGKHKSMKSSGLFGVEGRTELFILCNLILDL